MAVNCASIPETLIEPELFGYEEGAFTGARRKGSPGKILQANGGTLFLDEIGDMPTAAGAPAARAAGALRQPARLGQGVRGRCRHRLRHAPRLKGAIARGSFREDLYHRLNGMVVRLPAAARPHRLRRRAAQGARHLCEPGVRLELSDDVLALFRRYHWPGNFRQLHNVLRTAVALVGNEGLIRTDHLPDDFLDEMDAVAASVRAALDAARPRPGPRPRWRSRNRLPAQRRRQRPPCRSMPRRLPGSMSAVVARAAVAAPQLQSLAASRRMEDVALDAIRRAAPVPWQCVAAAKLLGVSRNTIYRKKGF